jgi:hypothetical protein
MLPQAVKSVYSQYKACFKLTTISTLCGGTNVSCKLRLHDGKIVGLL